MSFRTARIKAGLSQAAAAQKLGITAASVCQWETGKCRPRSSILRSIARLYNCAVDDLLEPDNVPPKGD